MPDGRARWSEPTGGFFTWLTLPEGLDARELRAAAVEAGVAYVPGRAVLRRATTATASCAEQYDG